MDDHIRITHLDRESGPLGRDRGRFALGCGDLTGCVSLHRGHGAGLCGILCRASQDIRRPDRGRLEEL